MEQKIQKRAQKASYNVWDYNLGQGPHECPYTIVNVLLFSFLNVGGENGSTQLKKLFLINNTGRKGEKDWREVTQVKCQKLYIRSEM